LSFCDPVWSAVPVADASCDDEFCVLGVVGADCVVVSAGDELVLGSADEVVLELDGVELVELVLESLGVVAVEEPPDVPSAGCVEELPSVELEDWLAVWSGAVAWVFDASVVPACDESGVPVCDCWSVVVVELLDESVAAGWLPVVPVDVSAQAPGVAKNSVRPAVVIARAANPPRRIRLLEALPLAASRVRSSCVRTRDHDSVATQLVRMSTVARRARSSRSRVLDHDSAIRPGLSRFTKRVRSSRFRALDHDSIGLRGAKWPCSVEKARLRSTGSACFPDHRSSCSPLGMAICRAACWPPPRARSRSATPERAIDL
jgi:hypothetical protein